MDVGTVEGPSNSLSPLPWNQRVSFKGKVVLQHRFHGNVEGTCKMQPWTEASYRFVLHDGVPSYCTYDWKGGRVPTADLNDLSADLV